MLLPLPDDPFTIPTDRDLSAVGAAGVRAHASHVRLRLRPPTRTVPRCRCVYYIPTDDDELLVSTMAGRGKARVVPGRPKVSLCVLDERWPFAYLQVYADAVIDHDPDLVVNVMMAVAGRMSGEPLGEEARPVVEAMAAEEQRVVVRCRPYATFAQPPRHLHRNDQDERITHWVSGTVRWEWPDPS